MAGNGREVALEVLTACRKLDAWSDGSLKAACRRGGLDRREAAFAARLTYGVLQNAALLDFYLANTARSRWRSWNLLSGMYCGWGPARFC